MIAQKTSLNALHIVLEQVILYNIPDQDCAFLKKLSLGEVTGA